MFTSVYRNDAPHPNYPTALDGSTALLYPTDISSRIETLKRQTLILNVEGLKDNEYKNYIKAILDLKTATALSRIHPTSTIKNWSQYCFFDVVINLLSSIPDVVERCFTLIMEKGGSSYDLSVMIAKLIIAPDNKKFSDASVIRTFVKQYYNNKPNDASDVFYRLEVMLGLANVRSLRITHEDVNVLTTSCTYLIKHSTNNKYIDTSRFTKSCTIYRTIEFKRGEFPEDVKGIIAEINNGAVYTVIGENKYMFDKLVIDPHIYGYWEKYKKYLKLSVSMKDPNRYYMKYNDDIEIYRGSFYHRKNGDYAEITKSIRLYDKYYIYPDTNLYKYISDGCWKNVFDNKSNIVYQEIADAFFYKTDSSNIYTKMFTGYKNNANDKGKVTDLHIVDEDLKYMYVLVKFNLRLKINIAKVYIQVSNTKGIPGILQANDPRFYYYIDNNTYMNSAKDTVTITPSPSDTCRYLEPGVASISITKDGSTTMWYTCIQLLNGAAYFILPNDKVMACGKKSGSYANCFSNNAYLINSENSCINASGNKTDITGDTPKNRHGVIIGNEVLQNNNVEYRGENYFEYYLSINSNHKLDESYHFVGLGVYLNINNKGNLDFRKRYKYNSSYGLYSICNDLMFLTVNKTAWWWANGNTSTHYVCFFNKYNMLFDDMNDYMTEGDKKFMHCRNIDEYLKLKMRKRSNIIKALPRIFLYTAN